MAEISRNVSTAANSPLKVSIKRNLGCSTPTKQSAKLDVSNYSSAPRPTPIVYHKLALSSIASAKQPTIQQQIQQRLPNKRDLAILHESKIFKSLLESAAKKKEEIKKRDPILQDNNEDLQQFKPSFKRVESVEYNSKCADENMKRAKKVGDFNERYNARPEEPKPEGIRAFTILPSQSRDENQRRQLKEVRSKSVGRVRCPITEGDIESTIFKPTKKTPEQFDHHQKINDIKFMLPAERGRSANGKVFRDTTVTIVGTDYSSIKPLSARQHSQPARPTTVQEQKMRGFIKGILEYEDGPNYRDQGVSDKCTTIKFVDILKGHVQAEERVFARKRTLG